MDVSRLYEAAELAVSEGHIIISADEKETFSSVSHALKAVFGCIESSITSFDVREAVLHYDADSDVFTVSSPCKCKIFDNYDFQSISFSAERLVLFCCIKDRVLDEDKKLVLTECIQSFTAEYEETEADSEIKGHLRIGEEEIELICSRTEQKIKEYYIQKTECRSNSELLSGLFRLLSIPYFLPEKLSLSLYDIKAVFEENTSFAVEAATAYSIHIGGIFEISSFRFFFEKFREEYSLGIGGKVKLLQLPALDFFARYESGSDYIFGVGVIEKTEFGFSHIAQMTGAEEGSNFPAELAAAEGLTLSSLTVHTDFKEIQSFSIEVAYCGTWILCREPELALSDVTLRIRMEGKNKIYGIRGRVTLLGKDVKIAGQYLQSKGWVFKAALLPYTTIGLEELAGEAAALFGAPRIFIPLDIKATDVKAEISLAGGFEFSGLLAFTGGSKDANIARILNGRCRLVIRRERKEGKSELDVKIEGSVILCGNEFRVTYKDKTEKIIRAEFIPKNEKTVSVKAMMKLFGSKEMADRLPECFNLSLTNAELTYDFTDSERKKLVLQAVFDAFEIKADLLFGRETDYMVSIHIKEKIDAADIPVAGEALNSMAGDTTISDFMLTFSKKEGVVFKCRVFGESFRCVMASPEEKKGLAVREKEAENTGTVKWIIINKNIGAFQWNRLGIEWKGRELSLKADISLLTTPFTFELAGAGIGADIPEFQSIHFLLDGFGISFHSKAVTVSGAFKCDGSHYIGEVGITAQRFSIVILGDYGDGGMTAYGVLSCPPGGPPFFTVTGLAMAFGYNRNLRLPDIERVADYPLIAAASGSCNKEGLIKEIREYITSERGQQFLTAGIKFTSYKVVNGFALATAAFGRETEIGLLGIADIVMPPECSKTPAARAQMALKAAILPSAGVASFEARLTEKSYILSEKCRLQGGFALYIWFGGIHKGDFVVTLGGYHPLYRKPAHYPDVPRLGFHWDVLPVPDRLVLTGEMYFALTPSTIMAGGRLSAVYSDGGLKAYFIAYADTVMQWKPFSYDIRVGIIAGASYRVDFWFIHHTFTIELAADLHIWGPEFSGKVHIRWFIISFTIPFGTTPEDKVYLLDWEGFRNSFIPGNSMKGERNVNEASNPLSLNITGESEDPAIRADDFRMTVGTVIPFRQLWITGKEETVYGEEIPIQPMNGTLTESLLKIELTGEKIIELKYSVEYGNVPSALWAKKDSGKELAENMPIGITAVLPEYVPILFPEKGEISEELLTESGKIQIQNAFYQEAAPKSCKYENKDTITRFEQTAESTADRRTELLCSLGFVGDSSLIRFRNNADNLFDDEILIGSVEE